MGLVYQRQDKNKEAIDAYEYCIAIDDHNTMGHLGKGNCLMELGDYKEAIKSLKSSLDNDILPIPCCLFCGKIAILISDK